MQNELYSEFHYDKFIFKVKNSYFYGTNHLWFDYNKVEVTIGLSDYLEQTIGDVAFISFPKVGFSIEPNKSIIEIETMKVNHEIEISFDGSVKDINNDLNDNPELINTDPYGNGWLVKVNVENVELIKNSQMTAIEYIKFLQNEIEHR